MWWRAVVLALLVVAVAGKGKKHRHQKPGRAVLDRLSSTTLSEVAVASEASGLLPAPLDVAPFSTVTANATCGQHGAEEFCRDTPGKRGVACDVCEGLEGSSTRRHPATLAVDGDPDTWWQSPIFTEEGEYQNVALVATLPGKMELLHVIIKSGPSPRPLAWSLEVSSTEHGDDWRLIRAFGDRDHCRKLWDLRPERRRRKARGAKRSSRADKPSCSTQFTSPRPLENGEMHVGIGEGVPARRVRVSFRAAHSSTRHQYYTVRELTLAARCICHGHAKHCSVDHKGAKCSCIHGACGAHCQRCCAGGAWRAHGACAERPARGDCAYDDSSALLCVNCTENRAGPLCDRCLIGYYNILPDDPCIPCDCDPEGSDGSCKWDRKHRHVQCACHAGFTGALCDRCESDNTVFPNCLLEITTPACKCDPRGITDPTRICDDICECKANVIGERCDVCATGYFGLSADLHEGCRPCYCSHVANHCVANPEAGDDVALPLGDAWLISSNDTAETLETSVDELGRPYLISYEVEGWETYFFTSPTYSGQRTEAYGGELVARITWAVARGDSGGSATLMPDYVLLANDGTRLFYGNTSYETPGPTELRAPLVEGRWYIGSEFASRGQLLDVLSNLRAIMIRAHFHFDQDEVRLDSIQLKGSPSNARETCTCPAGYIGTQCTSCAWTHVKLMRAPGSAPAFECVPCACNMHAGCEAVDGQCGPCLHNTTGPHCERCLPGHYGNPVQGACKPCACPLYEASNNFSPNCALASAEGDEFVCTQCPDGYTGDRCELCDSGYWGSPTTLGGSCRACECGGGPCHADSGKCLVCPPHTEGERCDQCQEGYWAGGANSSCVECACGRGSLSAACDARSGQCACAPGWTGRACDVCAKGFGGIEESCPPCSCGAAAISEECDVTSGDCTCAVGAAPPRCLGCLTGYYELTRDGCLGCNCSAVGAEGNACDIRTGQCRCRPHVTGRACDTCEEGYWGLEQGGCRRCECGAGASACDPVTALCACAIGVGGPRCDRCLPGYYGFGPTGCLPCPACTDGRVCSPITGRCVCPARTRGPGCQHCAPGYWGRAAGCRPCACGPGAMADSCDAISGQCQCRAGWMGRECSRCAVGHFGPRCRPCSCDVAGTRGCEQGVCACDQRGQCPCKASQTYVPPDSCDAISGQCQCRAGWMGRECSRCAVGHFGPRCRPCGCDVAGTRGCEQGVCACDQRGQCPCKASQTYVPPDSCDAISGQCQCRAGWMGRECSRCAVGHFGPRCRPCSCDVAGTRGCEQGVCACDQRGQCPCKASQTYVPPDSCDAISGQCQCRAGWMGRECSRCAVGHFGPRCRPCSCDVAGTRGCEQGVCACDQRGQCPCKASQNYVPPDSCDAISGQCQCRAGWMGRECSRCAVGHFGPRCRPCSCDVAGTRGCEQGVCACDQRGQCPCKASQNYVPPDSCDAISGQCQCRAGWMGRECSRCAVGHIGPRCRPCSCDVAGTRGCEQGVCACDQRGQYPCKASQTYVPPDSCDAISGQCQCRAGWMGRECSRCAVGHFGPRCRPCGCDVAGTRGCEQGACTCDQTGQCPCKENVVGEKCDTCLDGTFGLSGTNPVGCTACFCFGRSAKCTQAEVARAELHAATPLHLKLLRGDMLNTATMDIDSPFAVRTSLQEATIPLPWPPAPVYAELGELFLGDHVLSYGGALRFQVEEEGGEALPQHVLMRFPLVSIYGNNIILDYYERVPAVNGSHAVYLHESLWEVRPRPGDRGRARGPVVASRSALMLGLLDVQRLLLRLSTRAPLSIEPLHVLLLNVSLETAIAGLTRGAPAPGVERCLCPRGYDAASCHRPAAGFWMPPSPPQLHHIAGTIVINVEGTARPCECNNRAAECHPRTGHCLNCTHNTGGAKCERCAEGYYGTPELVCEPCPCPARDRPRAASCAVAHGRLRCYCKIGYTGPSCGSCASGFRPLGDECVPCECDARGAVSARCDAHARCRCKPYATGDKCHLCATRRHYLDEDGCKPCDNCTQTLLDTVEGLTRDLQVHADPSELSRIPQPYAALREFAHNASVLQISLQHVKRNLEKSKYLETSVDKLEASEHEMFTIANKIKTEASRREKEAYSLSLESMSGLEEVLKQRGIIGERVAVLDDFARGEKHLNAHRALKEARHLLKSIKQLNLFDAIAGATGVSDLANMQSTSIQEFNYRIDDELKRIHQLQSRLEDWEMKAEDIPKLGQTVWNASDVVVELKRRVVPKLAAVKDVGLRCRLILEDIGKLSTRNLTDETRAYILHTHNLAVAFPSTLAELQNLTAAAEEKEGILYNLTPKYKEKYLDTVLEHVAMLGEKAKEYKNLFAGTRAVASAGVQAARAWAEVAEGVRDASTAADAATSAADLASKLSRGPQPLLVTADEEKSASELLKRRGTEVLSKADELRRQLETAQRGTDAVSVGLRALGWRERALASGAESGAASGAGNNAVPTLRLASAQAERVFASTRALYDEAAETRRKVRYQLRRNLAALQRLGDTALGAAEEHVSQIRGNTLRGREVAEALAAAAAARAREHETAAASLNPALQALREQIQRAKHAASSISVSVTSPAGAVGCARAYSAWTGPAATRASLALSFESNIHDGTLLYLPDQENTERYMRLSVEKGRLRLRWNVGGGEGVIEHPEVLQPTLDDADHTTYRLHIERVWGTVRLRVERVGTPAITSSNSTALSPGSGLLRPALWWLGETGAPLPACVHSLHADHGAIGLWAFAKQPSTAKCSGCTQRWFSDSRGTEGMVWLGGAGYVALRRSRRPSDRRRFSLALTFRTTDNDALLFLAHDHANNRSVSVWVRACRVVFLVQYSESRLEITAGGRHCDGRPAHLQATRVFNGLERGSLRVNGEETLGSPSPPVQTAASLPELSGSTYWVGGLPPEGEGLGYESLPLLGCVGGIMVDREGYDLMDTSTRHGVESGCAARPLRSAVFEGSGYIELASPVVRRKTSVGVSFRARAPSGLILYRAPTIAVNDNEVEDEDGDDQHYLVLALVNGELEVMANAGKGELRLRMNGTKLDDGALHTVRLVRAHKQLEVWVDEKRVGGGALAGGALAARDRGLYVGGVPPSHASALPLPAGAFTGTVADFIVDSTWIGLETSVRRGGARLGRADGELRDARNEPRALHAQPDADTSCAKMSSYTVEAGAVKFGDVTGSYATLRIGREGKDKGAKGEFAFTLQLRTFAGDGLLMLLPGSKLKPKHYTALLVREGRLRLVVRGRRRREVTLAATRMDDGLWHSVTVRISRSRIVLSSAGAAATARAPPHSRAARLYFGGPPPEALVPHVPNSMLRVGGFVGCIRRVTINGRAEDLVRDARAHTAVGQCFPHIERGAYFAGDAYAEWAGGWIGAGEGVEGEGESIELRLQFRAASGAGVLAAIAGALLELRDGTVVISLGGARVESSARVCDGRWHAVRARVSRNSVWLALDAAPDERAAPALLPAASTAALDAPLYVGGLPEGATELAEGRENFKGCIRDVIVGGTPRDWKNARSKHNVLLDSCPVAQ